MIRVAICTPDLATGDAVSNDVIGMHDALTDNSYEVRIFAANAYVSRNQVYSPEHVRFFLRNSDDILIYHHSVGWHVGINILRELKCRKVVKYHNVTPAEFFAGIAENYCVACEAGRRQLRDITRVKADLYLADSEYNMNELLEMGARGINCLVLPPFHHIDRLQQIEADVNVINRYDDGKTNILMVGRVVPNKGYSDLIDIFNIYHREYNKESRLLIVGKEDPGLISYSRSLRYKVRELKLESSVLFEGEVSDRALKAYYRVADVFMITSMHEGFCVPLVEAMSMKIPIVAYGSTAIPGTVGKVGFVWDEQAPELMAASVNKIVREKRVRVALGEMGWRRYQHMFTNDQIKEGLLRAFRSTHLID